MPSDFSALDRPEVLMFLFHPRREYGPSPGTAPENATKVPGVQDVLIPVEKSIAVGARLHLSGRAHANILAEFDHIIPFADGQALYDAAGAADKTLLKVPGANHNDILAHGFQDYLEAVRRLSTGEKPR
jgi:hypothetical protein